MRKELKKKKNARSSCPESQERTEARIINNAIRGQEVKEQRLLGLEDGQ